MMSRVKQSLDKLQNNSNNVKVLIPAPWHDEAGTASPQGMGRDETENTEQGKITQSDSHFPLSSDDASKFDCILENLSSCLSQKINIERKNK